MTNHLSKLAVAVVGALLMLGAPVANASDHGDERENDRGQVSSLIVQYQRGVTPMRSDGQIRGTLALPKAIRKTMSLGSGLGNNMWTIKFSQALTAEAAARVCDQFERSAAVVQAEPDRKLSAFG